MNEFVRHYDTCLLCGSGLLRPVLTLRPTPIADGFLTKERLDQPQPSYPLSLYLCGTCGHCQMLDVVDPRLLFKDYLFFTSGSPWLVCHLKESAEELLARFPAKEGSLAVDIGSNDGTFLKMLKNKGLKVLGIDPAGPAAQKAREAGIETLTDFFSRELAAAIVKKRGKARIVTATNVFAHSRNLADMTGGVRELLSPDGIFMFEVSYLADLMEKGLFDTIYHEHVSYHAVKPLNLFFKNNGLRMVLIQRIASKGGSIRVFVRHSDAQESQAPSVSEFLRLEEKMGLDRPQAWREFEKTIEEKKGEFAAFLNAEGSRYKRIAGYGASPAATTLLYQLGLERRLEYLVDDNPGKEGLCSPGARLPVMSSSALAGKKPDLVVVLAWNYADKILGKHAAYLEAGGRFAVPLPSLRVL